MGITCTNKTLALIRFIILRTQIKLTPFLIRPHVHHMIMFELTSGFFSVSVMAGSYKVNPKQNGTPNHLVSFPLETIIQYIYLQFFVLGKYLYICS